MVWSGLVWSEHEMVGRSLPTWPVNGVMCDVAWYVVCGEFLLMFWGVGMPPIQDKIFGFVDVTVVSCFCGTNYVISILWWVSRQIRVA